MTERVKVTNLEIDYDSFCAWFNDENGNSYHDIMCTGEYSEGSIINVDYDTFGDNVRIIHGASIEEDDLFIDED